MPFTIPITLDLIAAAFASPDKVVPSPFKLLGSIPRVTEPFTEKFFHICMSLIAMPNKTLEPTAVGVVRSAIAVHVVSRRWLSFRR
jgi:hypothetical protein